MHQSLATRAAWSSNAIFALLSPAVFHSDFLFPNCCKLLKGRSLSLGREEPAEPLERVWYCGCRITSSRPTPSPPEPQGNSLRFPDAPTGPGSPRSRVEIRHKVLCGGGVASDRHGGERREVQGAGRTKRGVLPPPRQGRGPGRGRVTPRQGSLSRCGAPKPDGRLSSRSGFPGCRPWASGPKGQLESWWVVGESIRRPSDTPGPTRGEWRHCTAVCQRSLAMTLRQRPGVCAAWDGMRRPFPPGP